MWQNRNWPCIWKCEFVYFLIHGYYVQEENRPWGQAGLCVLAPFLSIIWIVMADGATFALMRKMKWNAMCGTCGRCLWEAGGLIGSLALKCHPLQIGGIVLTENERPWARSPVCSVSVCLSLGSNLEWSSSQLPILNDAVAVTVRAHVALPCGF